MESYIQGSDSYYVDVHGESTCQAFLSEACGGPTQNGRQFRTQALLRITEAGVAVEINGSAVGLLSPEDARTYRYQLSNAGRLDHLVWCEAMIVGGSKGFGWEVSKFGVKLDLPPIQCDLDIIDGPPQWPDGSRKLPRKPKRPAE
ncbi:hypothetical protein [Lacipirellula sp.]|uniref:hypothetical protein n=1 Tax=Lacipirellula sp. TaxID=2691419 RepID=UPI003D14AA22